MRLLRYSINVTLDGYCDRRVIRSPRVKLLALALLIILCAAHGAAAQGSAPGGRLSATVSVLGLASVHPVDDSYVGRPYLDHGLGGVGPGAALMFELVAPDGLTLVIEGSVANVEVHQTGRLVDGRDTGRGGATGRLRDPMLAVLGGITFGRHATTAAIVAGAGYADSVPAMNGQRVDRSDSPAVTEGAGHMAFVGGVHARRALAGRMSVVASARYALVHRSRRARELGSSRHVVRLGAGVSVRLGH